VNPSSTDPDLSRSSIQWTTWYWWQPIYLYYFGTIEWHYLRSSLLGAVNLDQPPFYSCNHRYYSTFRTI